MPLYPIGILLVVFRYPRLVLEISDSPYLHLCVPCHVLGPLDRWANVVSSYPDCERD
jgi:hypothetical protein